MAPVHTPHTGQAPSNLRPADASSEASVLGSELRAQRIRELQVGVPNSCIDIQLNGVPGGRGCRRRRNYAAASGKLSFQSRPRSSLITRWVGQTSQTSTRARASGSHGYALSRIQVAEIARHLLFMVQNTTSMWHSCGHIAAMTVSWDLLGRSLAG